MLYAKYCIYVTFGGYVVYVVYDAHAICFMCVTNDTHVIYVMLVVCFMYIYIYIYICKCIAILLFNQFPYTLDFVKVDSPA